MGRELGVVEECTLKKRNESVSHSKMKDLCLKKQRSQVQDFKYLKSTIQLNGSVVKW